MNFLRDISGYENKDKFLETIIEKLEYYNIHMNVKTFIPSDVIDVCMSTATGSRLFALALEMIRTHCSTNFCVEGIISLNGTVYIIDTDYSELEGELIKTILRDVYINDDDFLNDCEIPL